MRYFEIKEPYYALIKAETKEESIKIYVENVGDDEGNLKDEVKELDYYTALGKFCRWHPGHTAISRIIDMFQSKYDAGLLIVDSSLL